MRFLAFPLLTLVATVWGCRSASPRVTDVAAITRSALTLALAATLDRNGRFVLPEPAYRGTSPARADTIARAALAFAAGMAKANPGNGAGAFSSPDTLVPCGRRYYVLPVIDRLPADLPRSFSLPYLPRWIVPFCLPNGRSPVSVEVADAIPVIQAEKNEFVGSMFSQGEYARYPAGENEDAYLPLSPETAAVFAATQTHALVADVPVAIMTHPGNLGNVSPAKCMRWRITLDKPVRLVGEYGEYHTSEVYVRLRNYCFGEPVLQVADREQKEGGSIEYPRFGRNNDIESTQWVKVVFTRPLQFDVVRRVD